MNHLWAIVPYTRGRGIGPTDTFPHFLSIEDTKLIQTQALDFVVLTTTPEDQYKEAWRLIKPWGHLVVFLPDSVLPEVLCAQMEKVGSWDLVMSRDGLLVFKKLPKKGIHELSCTKPKPKKTACVVRYGGYGDMTQTSNILPGLKRQGYHITVMTTPKGRDILEHDPHVDAWFIQDAAQVPNQLLGNYWDYHRNHFDKFINLSMSIEGRCLMLPTDFRRHWPVEAIRAECDINYMELTNRLADVPFKAEQKFYPSAEETAWAKGVRAGIKGRVIMWALSGSSMHKATPFVDAVIARALMTYPDLNFILVGGYACQILQGVSWDNEPRVLCKAGEYSIRETLALAQHMDMVIGPQTGVLDSVALEPIKKIIFMSHSTENNLTKHWINTTALVPKNTPCYPCHLLHTGFGTCPKVEIELGGAKCETVACVSELDHDVIYKALRDSLIELEKAA